MAGLRGLRELLHRRSRRRCPIKGLEGAGSWFHQFWDDQGGDNLGQEYNGLVTYKLNKYVSFLWKTAYYDGGNKPAFSKRTRSILQTTFKF